MINIITSEGRSSVQLPSPTRSSTALFVSSLSCLLILAVLFNALSSASVTMTVLNVLMWVFLAATVGFLALLCCCRVLLLHTGRGGSSSSRSQHSGLVRNARYANNVLQALLQGRADFSGRRRGRGSGNGVDGAGDMSSSQMHAVLLRLALSHRQGDFTAQDYEVLQRLDELEADGGSGSDSDESTGSGSDGDSDGGADRSDESLNAADIELGQGQGEGAERSLARGLHGRRGRQGASRTDIRSLPSMKYPGSRTAPNHAPAPALGTGATNERTDVEAPPSSTVPEAGACTGGGGDGDDEQCSICLTAFAAGDSLRVLPCLHRYHMQCVDRWLFKEAATCPVCKAHI